MVWSVAITRPAGIRDRLPHLAQPLVGGGEHRGHPVAVGVERGAPGLRGDVLRVVLAEGGLPLLALARAPAHRAGVGQEDDRAHDAVTQRAAVAVGVVGLRDPDAAVVAQVAHERDGRGVRSERRAGERQPPRRRLERLADRVAPAERVAAVVHLVEDHERALRLGERAVQGCLDRDLRVGDDDAVELPRFARVPVAELRVEPDAGAVRGIRPLPLEVLGRRDDGDAVDDALLQQDAGEPQRERGLAGARRRGDEEVAVRRREVVVERLLLPRPQRGDGAACGAFREGRGELFGGRGRAECRPLPRFTHLIDSTGRAG